MTAIAFAAAIAVGQSGPSIRDVWQDDLKDFSFVARRVSANQRELAKINKDFGNAYRFTSTEIQYREPMMLRGESKVEDQSIVYILNGAIRRYRIPRAGINTREDLSRAPGKRQTTLDFGLITPSLFNNLFEAKFVRKDSRSGDLVFDLTYIKSLRDDSRHRVWIDPDKKFVTKREWYSQNDNFRLMATFLYEQPQAFGKVYIPTRLTVNNAEGKLAGVSSYTQIQVNKGIALSEFDVK
jgi:hypothetical protein